MRWLTSHVLDNQHKAIIVIVIAVNIIIIDIIIIIVWSEE